MREGLRNAPSAIYVGASADSLNEQNSRVFPCTTAKRRPIAQHYSDVLLLDVKMNRSSTILIVLFMQFIFFSYVLSYGFRNCIQNSDQSKNYICIQRYLQDVKDAVSDLPNDTQCLNVSHNLISQLPWGSFRHLPQLNLLRLDNNNLKEIQNGAFENLANLDTLNISQNKIQNLSRGAFIGLKNLTTLLIGNNLLSQVDLDAFHLLESLTLLDLASNHLQHLSQVMESISSLENLQTLNLCRNRFKYVDVSTELPPYLSNLSMCDNSITSMGCKPEYFSKVKRLDLSDNHIYATMLACFNLDNLTSLLIKNNRDFHIFEFLRTSNIRPESIDYSGMDLRGGHLSDLCKFFGNSTLPKLSLLSNNITYLNNDTFSNCPLVKAFDLSRNKLKNLHCLNFVHRSGLEKLVVQHNRLTFLEDCDQDRDRLDSLQELTLSFNRILHVPSNAFSFASNLINLYLNVNNIAFLSKHALQGLSKLEELRLDNNLLTDLFEESFLSLKNLRVLNLRNNRVAVIFPSVFATLEKLEILDLGGNVISSLTNMSLFGLKNLSKLYLDRNKLTNKFLNSKVFAFVYESLQVLDIEGNYFRYISSRKERSPFKNLKKLRDLKIKSQQPYGINIIPPKFFSGLLSLRFLSLANNKILTVSHNVFDDLRELRYLDLSDSCNGIQNLPRGIFRNQYKLESLNLENVGLQSLTTEVFGNLTNLRVLHLMKNALKIVNKTVVENLKSLVYIDLRKCPLSCTCNCNSKWFKTWLNNSLVQIVYPYNQSCEARPWTYIYKLDMSVCDLHLEKYCFIGTTVVILLFMIIPILYTRYYWHMKYNFYIFRAWFRELWHRKEKDMYKYDAFVSYNSYDEPWVLQELLPKLESSNPSSFRLCLHHRDFELGRDIIDNIVDSIYNSRKTICVISRNYLRSEWCSLEIQLASYRLLDERKDVLILIFLEKIPERELSVYHRMRKVMLKKTYISWPSELEAQKLFWAKVRTSLQSSVPVDESIDILSTEHTLLVESASLLS